MKYFVVIVVWYCYFEQVHSIKNGETKLIEHLFKDYNTESRPVANDSNAVVVRLGIGLHQLVDLKEKQEYFSASFFIRQYWKDESLVWDPIKFNNVTSINVSPKNIWLPDLVLYNNVDADKSFGGSLDQLVNRVIISFDGSVTWLTPAILKGKCTMNVKYFPFDTQICSMKIGSWTYNGLKVDLQNDTPNVDFSKYTKHSEWLVSEGILKRSVIYYTCCPAPFPDVTATFTLKRRSLFYLMNLIFPMVVISMLTMLSFYLPAESGERIALAITLLLAMTVFMLIVGEIIPPTSDSVPLVASFFSAVMLEMVLMVILLCYILKLHFKTADDEMPGWMRSLIFNNLSFTVGIRSREQKKIGDGEYSSQVKNSIDMNGTHDKNAVQQNGKYENGATVAVVKNGVIHKNGDINRTFENCFLGNDCLNKNDAALTQALNQKLDLFIKKMTREEEEERLKGEWRICALTIDRLCFFLFGFIFITTCFGIFLNAPEYVS